MALSPQEMDRRMDQHFPFEARTTSRGCWRRSRPMPSTTSSAGRPARPAAARRAAVLRGAVRRPVRRQGECIRRLYGDDFLVDESMWRGKAPGRPFGLEGRAGRCVPPAARRRVRRRRRRSKRENVWVDLAPCSSNCRRVDMVAAAESSDRQNQKRRTRKDLLQAASRLMKRGREARPGADRRGSDGLAGHGLSLFPRRRSAAARGVARRGRAGGGEVFARRSGDDPVARLQRVDRRCTR